jgi:hypothetical protein
MEILKKSLLAKKVNLRGSTKHFQNLKTDSDSATQNLLITDKIPNETFFIRAQINFDRKRSIGRTVHRYFSQFPKCIE